MRRIGSRIPRRMRKNTVQQGRSGRRGESSSPQYGEPLSDASTPAADVFRILLDTPHDKSSPCPMTMTPVLPGRKLMASRTARCFLPPSPLARFAHFKACVPWGMAPPAGKAAATSTVSANSGSEAPRVLALFVRSSMQ